MLVHIRQPDVAARIHNAWLCTLEDGVFTADLAGHASSRLSRPFGSMDFADAIIERLGRTPRTLAPVSYQQAPEAASAALPTLSVKAPARKSLLGVDVFVHQASTTPDALAAAIESLRMPSLRLQMITNRGVKVWPQGFPETFCTDHWRCRFMATEQGGEVAPADVVALLGALVGQGTDVIKTENLYTFDGVQGFALGQGQ